MMNHQKAFTLLEMLISVAVFALMAAIAYGGLSQVIRSSDQITQSNKALAELQFTFASFERDLIQLSHRKVRDSYGDEQPALKISKDRIILSRLGWENFLGAQRSHIQRVEYTLDEGNLLRRYWLTIDQTVEQQPIETVLLSNVKSLSLSVIDTLNEINIEWPNTTTLNEFPTFAEAVEIKIELENWGEVIKMIELVDDVE